jgi:ABC-2 type transport system permease protein
MPRLIAGEFRKLLTTRLWLVLLFGAIAITALYASLLIGFSDSPRTWTMPLTTSDGQRTLFATAAGGAAPLAAVLGAIGLTSEFRHRTATATFLTTPHRGRVVIAKVVTYGTAAAGFGLASLATVAAISLPWLSVKGIDLPLIDNGLPATMIGVVAAVTLFGLIGLGLGALLRDQVATVAGLLVYLFVVEPILTQIPAMDSWTVYLPGPAQSALTGITLSTQNYLDPLIGGALLASYAAVLAVAGSRLAVRRDIT